MSTLTFKKSNTAKSVTFDEFQMIIELTDGRTVTIPLEWFPKLRDASMIELKDCRFIGSGEGIHWEKLDEDLLVENLL